MYIFYLRFRYALTPKESSFIFFISLIHRNGCKNTKWIKLENVEFCEHIETGWA